MELGIWIVLLMIVFMFLGMPVAFSLGVAGLIGLLLVGGVDSAFSILSTTPYRTAAHYTLTTLPMFILMAQFISASQIVDDIFHAAQRWLERLPGGWPSPRALPPPAWRPCPVPVRQGTAVLLLVDGISLILLLAFPILSTYLPSRMIG